MESSPIHRQPALPIRGKNEIENARIAWGAYAARDKVGLKMNLPEAQARRAIKPALRNPVAHLAGAVEKDESGRDQSSTRKRGEEIIPQPKALGAEGIIRTGSTKSFTEKKSVAPVEEA
jgi:hypothetical protein